MAIRPCHMDGCEKPTGMVMASLGLCRMHYSRYRTWGDPYFEYSKRGRNVCVIEDCDELVIGRGWCSKHYSRWNRLGDPLARRIGEVVDGKRICPRCELDVPVEQYGAGRKNYCRPCANALARERRAANPVWLEKTERWDAECVACGLTFVANKRRRLCCSVECSKAYKIAVDTARPIDDRARASKAKWRKANPLKVAAKEARRRARKLGLTVESVDWLDVLDRDGWVCQLCSEPIERELRHPHPLSPSVDHRIPLARGGAHSMDNCQAAHFACNCRKGARILEGVS